MEKETIESLRLGTTMIFVGATLAIGLLIFWYARMYGGHYFDAAAAQNEQVRTAELNSISTSGIIDVPLASIYTIVAREWRAVSDVAVFDENGALITSGTAKGIKWELSVPLTRADGGIVTEVTAPEQILYAKFGGIYSSRISGRAYVTVTKNESTQAYTVQVKLQ